jgi:TolA-binding protein
VYPDERVSRFVTESFIPTRINVRQQPNDWAKYGERYGAQWTPTTVIVDPSGEERHRIEGFLPVEDFLPQLALGLAKSAFARQQFADAERRFREIVERFPSSDAAPEALYWAGASRYKATNDAAALGQTGEAFTKRYQETPWAKKASVWRK